MDKKTLKLIYAVVSIILIIGVAVVYRVLQESITTLNIDTAYVYPKLVFITSPSSSYIKTIYAKPGGVVKKAQPIVMLDDSILRKTLQMYKTELENILDREHIIEALYNSKILKIKKNIAQIDSEIKALGYELKLQKEKNKMNIESIKNEITNEIHRIKTLKTSISLLRHLLNLCNKFKEECTVFRVNLGLLREKVVYSQDTINSLKEKIQTLNAMEKYIEMGIQSSIDSKTQQKLNLKATIEENSQIEQLKLKQLAIEMLRLENKIQATDIKISYFAISSPIGGIVYQVYKKPGTYVQQGDKIVSLYNPQDTFIKMSIPPADVKYLPLGKKVTVYLPSGDAIPGVISSLCFSRETVYALINIPPKYRIKLTPFFPVKVEVNIH